MIKTKNIKNKLISYQTSDLNGIVIPPSDKSISHRALLFSSLAIGKSKISNLLNSEDVLNMVKALKALGIKITHKNNIYYVIGAGLTGFKTPNKHIDCGNSGTLARILLGALGGSEIFVTITGDDSLITRPMNRVIKPLKKMGINFNSSNGMLPLIINGTSEVLPIKYNSPISSAQVKTAILLAGLNGNGTSEIIEPHSSRDHSENLLKYFGADIKYNSKTKGKNKVSLKGGRNLKSCNISIPGDISSAAFNIVAATIIPGSDVKVKNVGINYFRKGLLEALRMMGANIKLENKITNEYNEPIADISVKYSKLKSIHLDSSYSARMIDEYPILSIAAAVAKGKSLFKGLSELRHKESDRFRGIIDGLIASGIKVEEDNDDIIIYGNPSQVIGGVTINCNYDHRIAMSFLILGAVAKKPIKVVGCNSIATSYPNFISEVNSIGMNIKVVK
jgi:3-phosphoshikimate 1-carboxyvinyltransferase